MRILNIGTRGSKLALWQTNWVIEKLQQNFPDLQTNTIIIKTSGDKILDKPLADIGDKGLFTKELDRALLNGSVDFAVHSLKDLPTVLPPGLKIAAITERWDVRDALIAPSGTTLDNLPHGATIATGSLRRTAQLLNYRPDLNIVDIRGNINTRLKKLDASDWQGMILAAAGVERLGFNHRIAQKIPLHIMMPAVGQGSFAVICRDDDAFTIDVLDAIDHYASHVAARVERTLLKTLEGGCHIPIGANATAQGESISCTAAVYSLNGRKVVKDMIQGSIRKHTPEYYGELLARRIYEDGGREILEGIVRPNAVSKTALSGLNILIAQSPRASSEFADQLTARGANVTTVYPFDIAVIPPAENHFRDKLPALLSDSKWLIFSSRTGVRKFQDYLTAAGLDMSAIRHCNIGTVGERSAMLWQTLVDAPEISAKATNLQRLLNEIAAQTTNETQVLHFTSELSEKNVVPEIPSHIKLRRLPLYRLVPAAGKDAAAIKALKTSSFDITLFTSPSAFDFFRAMSGLQTPLPLGAITTLGSTTQAHIEKEGWPVQLVAASPDPTGLLRTIVKYTEAIIGNSLSTTQK